MNKRLHWQLLTESDILISEYDNESFSNIDNIKIFYFTDGKNYYGIKNNLMFFVNNQVIDLKLQQKIIDFFQYKEDSFDLFSNSLNTSYFIGINTEDNRFKFKYTMIINSDVEIIAEKFSDDVKI